MPEILTPDWVHEQPLPDDQAVDEAMAALFPVAQRNLQQSKKLNGSRQWVDVADVDDLMLEVVTLERPRTMAHFHRLFGLSMYLEIVTREPRVVVEHEQARVIPGDAVTIHAPKSVVFRTIDTLAEEHRQAIARRLIVGHWRMLQDHLRDEEDDDALQDFVDMAEANLHELLLEISRGEMLESARARRASEDL